MIWDCQNGKTYWFNKQLPYESKTVCFLPESKEIVFATSRYSGDVRLGTIDIENGKILRQFNHPGMSRDLIKELAYSFCFPVNKNNYILTGGKVKFYNDNIQLENIMTKEYLEEE